jgi:branched-chain amino acid transport system permease protein
MQHRLSLYWLLPSCAALLAFPWLANYFGQEFYIVLATRILIFALAANSLNLILGFGGMVSLGHAAYLGCGAYLVAICLNNGLQSAWLCWPLALLGGVLLAAAIGWICLRTRGVYFIMITLAFAQMLYFLMISLRNYGGEDGITLPQRNGPGWDLSQDQAYYFVVLAVCAVCFGLLFRLLNSRFGRVIQAIRINEIRMEALGYPVLRYKLVCFSIAGGIASLAGALLANLNLLVSPNMLHWSQSGSLMVMVILGGAGTLCGGITGAALMLLLEELLSSYTTHWQLVLGAILLLTVLILPNGMASLFKRKQT